MLHVCQLSITSMIARNYGNNKRKKKIDQKKEVKLPVYVLLKSFVSCAFEGPKAQLWTN
jgi:hypothetical protein